MLNIFRIFISDFKRIKTNVVAVVIVIGLSILPCLYAWFNILSNWSPYGPDATSNIKVAVASDDKGITIDDTEFKPEMGINDFMEYRYGPDFPERQTER